MWALLQLFSRTLETEMFVNSKTKVVKEFNDGLAPLCDISPQFFAK
jgi:hypothetical protein